MNIICGTDFSVHAGEAATVAAALAARSNSAIKLVHAISPAQLQYLPVAQVVWLRDELRGKLIREGRRLRALGAEVLESLVIGTPHEVLTMAAKQSKADLIVVSSLGHVSPMRWLAGSVAERTAQHSTVPTLVVRDHEPLVRWAQGKRPLKVFICCDFSPSADAAIRWVASLKDLGPRTMTVVHVSRPPLNTTRFGTGADGIFCEYSPEVRLLLERDLRERCDALLDGEQASVFAASAWGRPDAQLVELAKAADADLMVAGTNQRQGLSRFWLGSVSRGILHHALTNVACVPMPDEIGIGQRGRSGIKKKLLGSVTEAVMRRSGRPALVIRE